MKRLLLIILLTPLLVGATYYRHPSGTAANKAAGVGPCSDLSACMNQSVFSGETFDVGDTIVYCHTPLGLPHKIIFDCFFDVSRTLRAGSPQAFEDKTAEANWTAILGTWDGINSEWDSQLTTANWIQIAASGVWYLNYRPTKARITFTGPEQIAFGVNDQSDVVLYDGIISSGDTVSLSWASDDIKLLLFYNIADSYSVTKIEFGW